jgi:hypothetical protein
LAVALAEFGQRIAYDELQTRMEAIIFRDQQVAKRKLGKSSLLHRAPEFGRLTVRGDETRVVNEVVTTFSSFQVP